MSETDDFYRDVLSPTAHGVLSLARGQAEAGTKCKADMLAVKKEAYSDDDTVWSCANGFGYPDALMIDDNAIVDNDVDALADMISNTMADASGYGQAAGWQIQKSYDETMKDLRDKFSE
ncbi:hypothetical protein NJBCHELONAE_43130 [Mycobacteroides chelonae]|uniref:hypothetical protein n=1 Tax=Mycobacteroides chelonae TaxID=1774 RepID=UPI0021DDE418|nr:hypothetical protein [Mycobacteroides chelonae]GLE59002.1 hypothetical protein NJBCHELONAE_43130 [Mycobacteroides chelonae]